MTSIAAALNVKMEASEFIGILSRTEQQLVYASWWNVAWYVIGLQNKIHYQIWDFGIQSIMCCLFSNRAPEIIEFELVMPEAKC